MIVMKFGGGCLRDASSVLRAARIASGRMAPSLCVVSALQGVTDAILAGRAAAAEDQSALPDIIGNLRQRHATVIDGAIPSARLKSAARRSIENRLGRLEGLLRRTGRDGSDPHDTAEISSYGERLAAVVFAHTICGLGRRSEVWEADAVGLVADGKPEKASADPGLFAAKIAPRAARAAVERAIPVLTGFFGIAPSGRISTFGRNGSDYSAAVAARALEASRLEFWKDTAGFMTADPKLVPEAEAVRRLTFREASELASLGARILHSRTLEPLEEEEIAIRIRNLDDPRHPGTAVIRKRSGRRAAFKCVTSNPRIAALRIPVPSAGQGASLLAGTLSCLAAAGAAVTSMITTRSGHLLLMAAADAEQGWKAVKNLNGGAPPYAEIRRDIALVAAVGEGVLEQPGAAGRVLAALAREKIGVETALLGASDVSACVVVAREEETRAVRTLHREFLMS